jgi:hypothetical protein
MSWVKWVIGGLAVASVTTAVVFTVVRKKRSAQPTWFRAFATNIVHASGIQEPLRRPLIKYIEDNYALYLKQPVRHPSHVLLHMASHPLPKKELLKNINKSLRELREQYKRLHTKEEQDAFKETAMDILMGVILMVGDVLMSGYDVAFAKDIQIDASGRRVGVDKNKKDRYESWDTATRIFPAGYTREFEPEDATKPQGQFINSFMELIRVPF